MPIGTIGTALISAKAAGDASERTAESIDRATAEARRQYDLTTADFAPYKSTGTDALGDYQKMLHGGYDMKESPAAQYQLTQGTKALNRAMASRGLSGSGNAVNRLTELNSSIAASDWNNQYKRLLDAINIGTSAAAKTASAGGQYVDNLNTTSSQTGANEWNNAKALSSIYGNVGNSLSNSAANFAALGTKSGWWGGSGDNTKLQWGGATGDPING